MTRFLDHDIYSRYAKEFDNVSVSERDKELVQFHKTVSN